MTYDQVAVVSMAVSLDWFLLLCSLILDWNKTSISFGGKHALKITAVLWNETDTFDAQFKLVSQSNILWIEKIKTAFTSNVLKTCSQTPFKSLRPFFNTSLAGFPIHVIEEVNYYFHI